MPTPQERYDTDAHFRMIVDVLTQQIIECNYSPSELRDAAMLAVVRYETLYTRPKYLMENDSLRRVDAYHGKQCTCNQPTRFGYCPVHEANR